MSQIPLNLVAVMIGSTSLAMLDRSDITVSRAAVESVLGRQVTDEDLALARRSERNRRYYQSHKAAE
jgi:hypothetical protein